MGRNIYSQTRQKKKIYFSLEWKNKVEIMDGDLLKATLALILRETVTLQVDTEKIKKFASKIFFKG